MTTRLQPKELMRGGSFFGTPPLLGWAVGISHECCNTGFSLQMAACLISSVWTQVCEPNCPDIDPLGILLHLRMTKLQSAKHGWQRWCTTLNHTHWSTPLCFQKPSLHPQFTLSLGLKGDDCPSLHISGLNSPSQCHSLQAWSLLLTS